MTYTVFIYKDGLVQTHKNFTDICAAFSYLGELDIKTEVERCILDNGIKILFDLRRDNDGNLTV